jgi:glycosyltransferase involved in cell wall biosynthesis
MKRLAVAGCGRVEAEFNWDQIARRTEEVYQEVLRGSK